MIMAQRRFEVAKLEFQFICSKDEMGNERTVSDLINKYMKKYASHTGYSISTESGIEREIDSVVSVIVEFSKEISFSTVNKILNHIINKEEIYYLLYDVHEKEVTVTMM